MMYRKKIIVIVLSLILLISCMVSPVYAADLYGSSVTVEMRWHPNFYCIAPVDSDYYYFYIISGAGTSSCFSKSGYSYLLVWSKERLIVENGNIVMSDPFYYYGSDDLNQILSFLKTEQKTVKIKLSNTSCDIGYANKFKVLYSNQSYKVEGTEYGPNWIAAVANSDKDMLINFFSSIYEGLKNAKLTIFSVKISAWQMIAGPFLIAFTVGILQKIIGVGNAGVIYSVSAGKNTKTKSKTKSSKEKKGSDDKK